MKKNTRFKNGNSEQKPKNLGLGQFLGRQYDTQPKGKPVILVA